MADETTTAEGQDKGGVETNAELEAARKELQLAKESARAQKQTFDLHRKQYQDQLEQFQRQQSNNGYGYEQPAQQEPDVMTLKKEIEYLKAQQEGFGITQYKVDNPDWRDSWDRVQDIVNDEVKASEVAVFDRHGNVDYNRSLRNAKREVELEDLRKAKAATEAAKKDNKVEQDRQKGMGTISGTSASEIEEGIDVEGMTSDDMIDQGLVEQDPSNPIRPLFPKTG